MMGKISFFTVVTPLPPEVTRDTALETLHNHSEMIELNPLGVRHSPCKPPPNCPADEYHCVWYEMVNKVNYLPGVSGNVTYKVCFHNLDKGIQTHCYAPTGLDIKEKYTIGGNMPGEPREVPELGVEVPREGLYLRDDIHIRCGVSMLAPFIKKQLVKSHKVLIDRLLVKAQIIEDVKERSSTLTDSSHRSSSVRGSLNPNMTYTPSLKRDSFPADADWPGATRRSSSQNLETLPAYESKSEGKRADTYPHNIPHTSVLNASSHIELPGENWKHAEGGKGFITSGPIPMELDAAEQMLPRLDVQTQRHGSGGGNSSELPGSPVYPDFLESLNKKKPTPAGPPEHPDDVGREYRTNTA